MAPIPSTHSLIREWVPQLLAAVPPEVMERYRSETCINGDLGYKLPQLLSAATNDVAHDQAIERAHHVIKQCLLIRDFLRVGEVLSDSYFPADIAASLEQFSCMSVVGDDTKGNTVIYFDLSHFNPTEYARCWELGHRPTPVEFEGHEDLMEPCVSNLCSLWYVRMMEWIHVHRFEAFKNGQIAEPRVVMILNVGSIGLSTWTHELRQFLRGIKILGNYLFPEICDYIFAANVPWVADKFWPVVKLCLHPATSVKVGLYDKKRTVKHLKDLMSDDNLPPVFGGVYKPEKKFDRKVDPVEEPPLDVEVISDIEESYTNEDIE
jgi:hypothetical protein